MCGITGYASSSTAPSDAARLARMVRTLRHRGPDDTGLFVDGAIALGLFRRLGINRVSDIMNINPSELMERLVKLAEPRIEGVPAHKNRSRKSINLDVLRLPEHLILIPSARRS
jgi:glutamate synthase domain-containing protein 1